nr:immunoglobulin light chain junction region [Macaca mulatta]MOW15606.1 immunoglobulin light chain junction region [Macaca mulatta]
DYYCFSRHSSGDYRLF